MKIEKMTKKQLIRNIILYKIQDYLVYRILHKRQLNYFNKSQLYSILIIQTYVLPYFEKKNLPFDIELEILSYIH